MSRNEQFEAVNGNIANEEFVIKVERCCACVCVCVVVGVVVVVVVVLVVVVAMNFQKSAMC